MISKWNEPPTPIHTKHDGWMDKIKHRTYGPNDEDITKCMAVYI